MCRAVAGHEKRLNHNHFLYELFEIFLVFQRVELSGAALKRFKSYVQDRDYVVSISNFSMYPGELRRFVVFLKDPF